MDAVKPKASVTIEGKKLGLLFDVNSNPTKKGIKMHFVLEEKFEDPRDKQALASKISTALQKKFGDDGEVLMIGVQPKNLFDLKFFSSWYQDQSDAKFRSQFFRLR